MYNRTLGDVRPTLATVAAMTGLKTTDPRLLGRINRALQMIMESADMPLLTDMITFTVTKRLVTLPFDKDRIMEANLDSLPVGIRSPWFEYIEMGASWSRPIDFDDSRRLLFERNESPTAFPIPDTDTDPDYNIVVQGTVDEVTGVTPVPVFNIRGLDENGEHVRTDSGGGVFIEGENLTMVAGSPFETTSVTKFSVIQSVTKPVTKQHVKLIARAAGNPDVELSDYRYNETFPSYRTYKIPSIIEDDRDYKLNLRVKSRFIPLRDDTDLMPISNIQALIFAMIAQHKAEVQKPRDFEENYLLAKNMLNEEARTYRGKQKTPAITFRGRISIGGFRGY